MGKDPDEKSCHIFLAICLLDEHGQQEVFNRASRFRTGTIETNLDFDIVLTLLKVRDAHQHQSVVKEPHHVRFVLNLAIRA